MLDSQKHTIKNRKQNQSQKLQYIYMKYALKIGYFFQGNSKLEK